jgi:hypothetical protein
MASPADQSAIFEVGSSTHPFAFACACVRVACRRYLCSFPETARQETHARSLRLAGCWWHALGACRVRRCPCKSVMPSSAVGVVQVFVHAAWAPDEDEATPGQDEAEEQVLRQKHQEAEEAGFSRFGERIGALHDRFGSLPPPTWWQDVTDSQLAVGFSEGAAAARAHALVSPLWWVDMSPTNKALVVVRDGGLTLFSASDEFSSPRADWEGLPVSGERGFQWRRVAWSQDGKICVRYVGDHQTEWPVDGMKGCGSG